MTTTAETGHDCYREAPATQASARAARASSVRSGSPRWSLAANSGAVLSALAASACCIGPLVLALLGLGGAGLLLTLAPYRPYFAAVALVLLGTGFYLAYRRPRTEIPSGGDNACGCPAPRANRAGRIILWVAAVLAVAFLAFPYVAALIWG